MSPGARSPRVKKSPPGSRARRKGQAAIYNSPAPHCPTWRPSHGRAEVKAIPGPVTAFGGRLGGRGESPGCRGRAGKGLGGGGLWEEK